MAAQRDAGAARQRCRRRRGSAAAAAIVSRMKPVQTAAARAAAASSPPAGPARTAGADSVRRRLSSIFQRPIAGIARARRSAPASRPRPKIHGSNCQSPRAQRCWRARADVVAGGKLLDHLDVGGQPGAGEDALEQIVAEQRRFPARGRRAPPRRHRRRRCPCRRRSLRRTGPGRRRRPRRHRDRCRSALEKTRWNSEPSRPTGSDGRDPRLQHARSPRRPGRASASKRGRLSGCAILPISRADGVARQPRIGVERDDVADAGGHASARRPPIGMKLVSVAPRSSRFSSCSLPRLRSQPIQRAFAVVPDPPAMQQQEAVAAGRRAVARVQPRDARPRRRRAAPSSPSACSVGGIGPVGQQREMQIAFRTGEVVDLQPLDLLLDRRRRWSAASAPRRSCAGARARRRAAPAPAAGVAPKPRVDARG